MQFLDAIGLAYFWEKIKSWVGKNYLSLKGGNIEGSIQIDNDEDPGLRIIDGTSYSDQSLTISPTRINMSYTDEDSDGGHTVINDLDIQKGLITARSFTRIGGTSAQALIADGSVKGIGSANGIAGLDANGNVPLANLGNLDTTVAEVVTELPTSNIKRHIYLVKDSDTTNNKYAEYVYTGDISAAYDSTKWEKLGDFRATVDLADYAKKRDAVNLHAIILNKTAIGNTQQGLIEEQRIKFLNIDDNDSLEITFENATTNMAGFMSVQDKNKLDRIAENANNYSLPLAANGTRGGIQVGYAANGRNYPVQLSGEKAYVNVPWTDTNTTYDLSPYAKTADVNAALAKKVDVVSGKGLSTEDFTAALKTKLNGIATGATADSAITTAEIDALFT
ncbi:hypothetical protein [Prevotella sp.]|uniref:hypothetical protein n=1 Tax=Prevotella sp. TaxID=59823 RepID=UPI002585ECA3|nr:hypothetical protein [Prevotella sp.]